MHGSARNAHKGPSMQTPLEPAEQSLGERPIGVGNASALTINGVTCVELHALAKASEASMVRFTNPPGSGNRIQFDGNGQPVLVYGNCPLCDSTLAVRVAL